MGQFVSFIFLPWRWLTVDIEEWKYVMIRARYCKSLLHFTFVCTPFAVLVYEDQCVM